MFLCLAALVGRGKNLGLIGGLVALLLGAVPFGIAYLISLYMRPKIKEPG